MADGAEPPAPASLLRNHGGGHAPVTYLELFFDLVYVFAITQLSHFLLKHLDLAGFFEGIILFLAVWWAWMYTTWAANWADPEKLAVRLMLLVAMLLGMVMAVAIPDAFGANGMLFVVAYLTAQLGRSVFMAWAMRRDDRKAGLSMVRIACWFVASGVCWVFGALQGDPAARIGWWGLGVTIEYLGPVLGFRTPLLGASRPADWTISGSHMAERCALFIIIALGEGIIVTGATFAGEPMTPQRISAFLSAFLCSVLMWWLYFDVGAERGSRHIEGHEEPGKVARNAYTYLHMPIVAGVVLSAVADAMLLESPDGPAPRALVLIQTGGLATYLLGLGAFKQFSSPRGNFPLSHSVGCLVLLAVGAWAWAEAPLALVFVAVTTALLAVIAIWEWGSFHGGWEERFRRAKARQKPSPTPEP
jgi:low temperature requirement protein LtrA